MSSPFFLSVGVMNLSSSGVMRIVTARFPKNQLPKRFVNSADANCPPATSVVAPQIAPARLFMSHPKTRNTPMSFFVLIAGVAFNIWNAVSGIKTCHTSASDQ